MARTPQYVLERLDALRIAHDGYAADHWRIRQIMNGGPSGIEAIMAWDQGKGSSGRMNAKVLGTDLPAVNMMASGVERLAQKIGVAPTLKMPYGNRDSDEARKKGEKRERLIESWDHQSELEMMYPQLGRWLPGYGFAAIVLKPKRDPVTGQLWPDLELRDPYDTMTGYFGVRQQPVEVAFRRHVPVSALEAAYPDYGWGTLIASRGARGTDQGGAGIGWEGKKGGVQILEFHDSTGCYVCAPEFGMIVDYYPNVLDTGPMFHVFKRFAFDRLLGQYAHVIGLTAMQAKLNVLALMASEDSAFNITNVFGEMESETYEKGRNAVNQFERDARVEVPRGDNNQQIFQQIDRVERQLRIGAAYDQGSDSLASGGGFITGKGQRELRDPIDANIGEYQKVTRHGIEKLDTRRLEWEEKTEGSKKKRVFWIEGDRLSEETYQPDVDIDGYWRSRRVYGMMATWDDNSKIVAGLQLLQGDVIDTQELQENLDGLDDITKINQRIDRNNAKRDLMEAIRFRAGQGDPLAAAALVEILDKPQNTLKILKKFFTVQEPEMSPEEAAMGGVGGGAENTIAGPPPDVQTVLSRLTGSGGAEGGVQTVGTKVG